MTKVTVTELRACPVCGLSAGGGARGCAYQHESAEFVDVRDIRVRTTTPDEFELAMRALEAAGFEVPA